ncbi:hypothetical protein AP1_0053 [Aeromonas phage AP1]|nr:hypothetical protein AP1_0053 [Aeromonas phage AP1]
MMISPNSFFRDEYVSMVNKKLKLFKSSEYLDRSRLMMSPDAFQQELGTICLDMGRQTGKTSAAIMLLEEHKDALYVVHNHPTIRSILSVAPHLKDQVLSISDFVNRFYSRGTYNHVIHGSRIEKYSMIIIDEPYFTCTNGQRQFTNRNSCSYNLDGGKEINTTYGLISYAAFRMDSLIVKLGMQ